MAKYSNVIKTLKDFMFRYIIPKDSLGFKFYKKIKYLNQLIVLHFTKAEKYTIYPTPKVYKKLYLNSHSSPKVSIVIPVHNNFLYTYLCLNSIIAHSIDVDYEVIIGDDASTDQTKDIGKYCENIIVSRNRTNLGFLKNCNNAAKKAKGQYILFLNNDTQVQDKWLSYLVGLIENNEQIGMVGSKLVYPNGMLQEAGGVIWKDGTGMNYGRQKNPEKPEFNYVREVDYISGASILIRKNIWEIVGGFDERFSPAYYEDCDLAFQVRATGYKVIYQPKSVVIHFEGISHGTSLKSGIKQYQNCNRVKFVEKWNYELNKNHFPNAFNVFQARDRTKDKKTILVIDQSVPSYDKDAGSKVIFLYLKLFTEMGLNVKYIGNDFIRSEPYTTELQLLGVEVLYGFYMQYHWKEWIIKNSEHLDYVFLCRPVVALVYLDFIKKNTNSKILYFGHDLHYLRELRQYEITQDLKILKKSNEVKKVEELIFNSADSILTISCDENKIIPNEFNLNPRKVFVFPMYYYGQINLASISFNNRNDLLFVGGFRHTPNIDGVIWFVNNILPIILSVNPNIKIHIVGSNSPKEITQLSRKNIKVYGYISDDELIRLHLRARVFVVPLRYGAGVKGKVVDAIYNGLPIVGTSIAFEGLIDIGSIYTPHDNVEDFASEVIRLYNNSKLLSDLSLRGRKYILNYFSKDTALKIMKSILNG